MDVVLVSKVLAKKLRRYLMKENAILIYYVAVIFSFSNLVPKDSTSYDLKVQFL